MFKIRIKSCANDLLQSTLRFSNVSRETSTNGIHYDALTGIFLTHSLLRVFTQLALLTVSPPFSDIFAGYF